MLTFEQYVLQNHPEIVDEGFFDGVKKFGRTAALAGAMAGAGWAANNYMQNQNIPSSSTTYPAAAQFVQPSQDGESWTSPDAAKFLPQTTRQAQPQQQLKKSRLRTIGNRQLQNKANQLRQSGRTSGTFVHDELQ